MSCYCEGTQKGLLRIRDVEKGGECILMLRTQFTEKVRMIHYNKTKNVLFVASKDGQFRIWKIPHEWRSKVIDEREMNAEYERRRKAKIARNSQTKTTVAAQGSVRWRLKLGDEAVVDKNYYQKRLIDRLERVSDEGKLVLSDKQL